MSRGVIRVSGQSCSRFNPRKKSTPAFSRAQDLNGRQGQFSVVLRELFNVCVRIGSTGEINSPQQKRDLAPDMAQDLKQGVRYAHLYFCNHLRELSTGKIVRAQKLAPRSQALNTLKGEKPRSARVRVRTLHGLRTDPEPQSSGDQHARVRIHLCPAAHVVSAAATADQSHT